MPFFLKGYMTNIFHFVVIHSGTPSVNIGKKPIVTSDHVTIFANIYSNSDIEHVRWFNGTQLLRHRQEINHSPVVMNSYSKQVTVQGQIATIHIPRDNNTIFGVYTLEVKNNAGSTVKDVKVVDPNEGNTSLLYFPEASFG